MKVFPEFFEAIKRGVILDVGHGKKSFSWKVAEKAIADGIKPNTISTDLWIDNINGLYMICSLPCQNSYYLKFF